LPRNRTLHSKLTGGCDYIVHHLWIVRGFVNIKPLGADVSSCTMSMKTLYIPSFVVYVIFIKYVCEASISYLM
jgi:hypothetical protein